MGERAITWAQEQRCSSSTVKFVLMRLAAYADVEGVAWAFVERLADEVQATDRTVQRALRALEEAGLIKHTGKFHHRNVPFYRLQIGRSPEMSAPARKPRPGSGEDVPNGDRMSPLEMPNGDMGVTVNGDMGVTPKQGNPSEREAKAPLSERERANERRSSEAEDCGFTAAFRAYPASGRKKTSDPAARAAWMLAAADVGEKRLFAAVQAFAVDPDLKRGDFGAPSMQRWLGERRYLAFVVEAEPQVAPSASASVCGLPPPPAQLRADFVTAFDAVRAGSYFPLGMTADGTLVCRGVHARDWMRRHARGWLEAHDLTVIAASEVEAERQALERA